MNIDTARFRVRKNQRIDLAGWPTRVDPVYKNKSHYKELLAAQRDELAERQELLYADGRYALLVVLQGMDTSGKDGVIEHVMSGVNPQGLQVYSFKRPGAEEYAHDFLWGPIRRLPPRGHIGIFNRSYYEEVLVVRVHPEILRSQRIPHEDAHLKTIWRSRYRSIGALEDHLHRNGTRIIKFFLHLSKEEQRRRLLERLEDPAKRWKYNPGDVEERKLWNRYMRAYADCLSATSTQRAPWYVVPADDKRNARLIISRIVVEALKALPLAFPKVVIPASRRLV
ncbi:MAG TPA: polyphosphate kinase 2 family protein [Burkholderiales bacterium]|nr:polyphosphate kinase 2 family protein [Burkholderiales bacterium]